MIWNIKYVLFITFCVLIVIDHTNTVPDNDDDAITISLTQPQNVTNQFYEISTLLYPKTNIVVNVINVSYLNLDFFIIQIHSYYSPVVLSNTTNFIKTESVTGTNIGLVQIVTKSKTNYEFHVKNRNKTINATMLYIVVIPYQTVPIPGGCNMEFITEIAPYQILKYTDAVITVYAQSASMKGHLCESQIVKHEVYRLYMPEIDFTPNTYFDSIRKMLTVMDVINYGTQVSTRENGFLRQMYNAYKGTGSVYVIIASVNNSKSVYVPIVSYACDIMNNESCDGPSSVATKILCSLLIFLGLFTCFFGHKFFRTEMFLVGALVGGYISYLILILTENFNETDTVFLSLGIGCLLGLVWLSFWQYCGIPILSTLLMLLVLGFLVGSVAFYAGLSDLTIVRNDITYWGFFVSIVLLCMTIFTSFIHKANIIACGIIGAYAFILPLDHYYGTNLKYIFINTIRRATVPNFGSAVIDAPYQWQDSVLTVLWVGLAFSGVVFQWRQQIGRPPFPPTSTRLQPPNERTPLLRPRSSVGPSDRLILIHSASPDV